MTLLFPVFKNLYYCISDWHFRATSSQCGRCHQALTGHYVETQNQECQSMKVPQMT